MKNSKLIPIYIKIRYMSFVFPILFGLLFSYCTHLEQAKCQSAKCIYIQSNPTAKLFINGTYIGMTSANKVEVESGSLIELKAEGYETSSIKLGDVRPNGLTVKKVRGSGGINISGMGLKVRMKKQKWAMEKWQAHLDSGEKYKLLWLIRLYSVE